MRFTENIGFFAINDLKIMEMAKTLAIGQAFGMGGVRKTFSNKNNRLVYRHFQKSRWPRKNLHEESTWPSRHI
jgi:hypothetical protein